MSETTNRSIRIEYIGTTTYATVDEAQHVATPRPHVHLKCRHGAAYLAKGDTFDPYEGARIALARAFGQDPFPVRAKKPEPGQNWRPVTRTTELHEGDLIRTTKPYPGDNRYKPGDVGVYIQRENNSLGLIRVKFDDLILDCSVDIDVEEPEFLRAEDYRTGGAYKYSEKDYLLLGESAPSTKDLRLRPVRLTGRRVVRGKNWYDFNVLRADGSEWVPFTCIEDDLVEVNQKIYMSLTKPGHWEKIEVEDDIAEDKRVKNGCVVRIVHPWLANGRYEAGDMGILVDTRSGGGEVAFQSGQSLYVSMDSRHQEAEVWVNGEKPTQFRDGDVVKLANDPYFSVTCRGHNAVIYGHDPDTGMLFLKIKRPEGSAPGVGATQSCDRTSYSKLTLVYRKEGK